MSLWEALLDEPAAERAVGAAAALAGRTLADSGFHDSPPSVASGSVGAALLLAALDQALPGRGYAGAAVAVLDEAVSRAAEQELPDAALYAAPIGLGWAYAVIGPRLPDGEADDEENDVDGFVSALLRVEPWPGPVDLAFGLAGLGTYALARLPLPSARAALDRVVALLASTARADGSGVTWEFVPPSRATFQFTETAPAGHVDVGFAHGVAGIVTVLAEAHRAGAAGARELLEPAVRWLLARRLPPSEYGAYPSTVRPDGRPNAARLAWCYGDPGVAVALLAAGDALDDAGLRDEAREVAAGCAGRTTGEVTDKTLCHGSAGLGHMFNRLGQALADERLLDLAREWFAATLADGLDEPAPEAGILVGAPGTALALLSAAGVEPWWDQVLLVRPRW